MSSLCFMCQNCEKISMNLIVYCSIFRQTECVIYCKYFKPSIPQQASEGIEEKLKEFTEKFKQQLEKMKSERKEEESP